MQCHEALDLVAKHLDPHRMGLIDREDLERVATNEQDAGRLDALREINRAIEAFKQMPAPPRPDQPEDATRETQTKDTTRPTEDQPNKPPVIFEGIHDELDPQQASTPKPLDRADGTSWAGYHLLEFGSGRQSSKFLIKLDAKGGTLLMTSSASQPNDRFYHAIPIEIVSKDDSQVLIKHQSDRFRDTTVMHVIDLVNGKPASCKTWSTDQAYTSNEAPSQTGQVSAMGNPDADLLGLADGVYIAEMQQTINKANRREVKTIHFEITVDGGHAMVSRHHKGDRAGWSEWHPFMLVVETTGSELAMSYDRDEFDWADLFVIDMSDKANPVLKHWWRGDWRNRGDGPSAVGALVKQ